jgi:hypothetical protein
MILVLYPKRFNCKSQRHRPGGWSGGNLLREVYLVITLPTPPRFAMWQ